MDLITALNKVKNGGRITKLEWDNRDVFISLYGKQLTIRMEDKKFHPWIISDSDLFAEDWEYVTDA